MRNVEGVLLNSVRNALKELGNPDAEQAVTNAKAILKYGLEDVEELQLEALKLAGQER